MNKTVEDESVNSASVGQSHVSKASVVNIRRTDV